MSGDNILSIILGSGDYRYKVIENWAQLPGDWSFMDVAGVAVNSKDEVFVFNISFVTSAFAALVYEEITTTGATSY